MSDPFAIQASAVAKLPYLHRETPNLAKAHQAYATTLRDPQGFPSQQITAVQWSLDAQVIHKRNSSFASKISGPTKVLLEIFSRWEISDADAAVLLGKQSEHFVERLRAGATGLSDRDTKDRVRLLINIYEGIHSLFRTPESERAWIMSKHEPLAGLSVLDAMLRGSMIDLLHVRAFVQHANGR